MQNQSILLATGIALTLVMSSVGHAQSIFTGNEFSGTIVLGEQVMIQPTSVMPVGIRVDSYPVYGNAPAPTIPFDETQTATPFVAPTMPVVTAAPVQLIIPPVQPVLPRVQHVLPPVQHVLPPVQHRLPITSVQQPVCLSGG